MGDLRIAPVGQHATASSHASGAAGVLPRGVAVAPTSGIPWVGEANRCAGTSRKTGEPCPNNSVSGESYCNGHLRAVAAASATPAVPAESD